MATNDFRLAKEPNQVTDEDYFCAGAHRACLLAAGIRSKFESLRRHGWVYDDNLSIDRNYMNFACLLARNSTCTDGHMACVFVKGIEAGCGDCVLPANNSTLRAGEAAVLLCTINTSMFADKLSSDTHAEANAVAEAARCGLSLHESSIYVTMPPCKNCYKLLSAAGVRRIVSRRACCSPGVLRHMAEQGIEFVHLEESAAHLAALEAACRPHLDRAAVERERLKRKEVRAAAKQKSCEKRLRKEQCHEDSS